MFSKTCVLETSTNCLHTTNYETEEEYNNDTLYRNKNKFVCKNCESLRKKQIYIKNKNTYREYYIKNKDKLDNQQKNYYYNTAKEKMIEKQREYRKRLRELGVHSLQNLISK